MTSSFFKDIDKIFKPYDPYIWERRKYNTWHYMITLNLLVDPFSSVCTVLKGRRKVDFIPRMDTLFSVILGELASRSFSFLIDRCNSKPPSPPNEERIQRLERMLLRLTIIIEEADRRCISNHGMLRHVDMLRQDMHKGYYVLDCCRFQKAHEEEIMSENNDEVNHSLALSKFNFSKRARIPTSSRRHGDKEELKQMVDNIETIMADMVEFALLLNNYPCLHRQPYNTYLFMDKCMFRRQMEMEHVINFLFHAEPPNTNKLGVLAIIGPSKVGKSILVEHVCYDERVRDHFSRIIFLSDNDFKEEKRHLDLRDSGVIKYKRNSSSSASNEEERILVIVEPTGDVADDEWRRIYSSSRSCISAGSKIIITSRSEKIANLGTTQPLFLKLLPREAYWYYFKVLTFGSSDPKDLPKLASISIAMFNGYFDHELYKEFIGPFIDLSNLASLLQTSVYERNWLISLRERVKAKETKNHFLFSKGSCDSGPKSRFMSIPRRDGTVHYCCEVYDHCQVGFAYREEEEVPKIEAQDILSGRVAPRGKFDLVLWRSHLPPYYSYTYSCEIHKYRSVLGTTKELRHKRKI